MVRKRIRYQGKRVKSGFNIKERCSINTMYIRNLLVSSRKTLVLVGISSLVVVLMTSSMFEVMKDSYSSKAEASVASVVDTAPNQSRHPVENSQTYQVEKLTLMLSNDADKSDHEVEVEPVAQVVETEPVVENTSETLNITLVQYSQGSREDIIKSKVNAFVTSKTLSAADIKSVEPRYDSQGKMFIGSRAEAMCLDIRNRSYWTADDFYSILKEDMYDLVPVAIKMEEELGINALYIIAVGANETGWGRYMAGDYNYFNWTNNGINHFDFDSIESFTEFSLKTYENHYVHEDFYSGKLGFIPEHITPEVVNVKYAINLGGGTNWQWSNVVCDIMRTLCSRLEKVNNA